MRATLSATLVAAALLPAPAALAQGETGGEAPRRITVSGSAEVRAAPDLAMITAGVETQDGSAADALEANDAAMTEVLAALEGAGVAPSDVQTSQFDLSPVRSPQSDQTESPEIVAYAAINMVTVRLRDVGALGTVLDVLAEAGANRFYGIGFDIADEGAHLDAARGDAVADARRKAELYAEAAGVTLGPVLSITESGGYGPVAMRAQAMDAEGAPVSAGEVVLSAGVEVVWEIE
jgi:uncharacterized protein